MFCSACGQGVHEDARFCEHCGAQFQEEGELIPSTQVEPVAEPVVVEPVVVEPVVVERPVVATARRRRATRRRATRRRATRDPYKDQIAEFRLAIKQLKLELKQITTEMANTRAQYYQTAAFVPHGILHKGYKLLEDIRLMGPQQQKQQLQQEILRLEQELLDLQQAQIDWKEQRAL